MVVKLITNGNQRTLAKPIQIIGPAPFSSNTVCIKLLPRFEEGIVFKYKNEFIPLSPRSIKMQNISHTSIIKNSKIEIVCVEHLLAALYGLDIDSVLIELSGDNQIPALDSSAKFYTQKIVSTGFKDMKHERFILKIKEHFIFKDPESDSFAEFYPSDKLKVNIEISFNNIIGTQKYSEEITPSNFQKNICWARTFIRSPINNDRAKWDRIRKIIPILPKNPKKSPIIVFSDKQFITTLIEKDEPVRHKVLDFLGDLALLGVKIEGEIKVFKPSHYFNHKLIKFLYSKL